MAAIKKETGIINSILVITQIEQKMGKYIVMVHQFFILNFDDRMLGNTNYSALTLSRNANDFNYPENQLP
jgi:hypothetical protein